LDLNLAVPKKGLSYLFNAAWTEQDAIMLLRYLHLAAPKSELFRLKWVDVDFAGVKVRLYTRKTRDGSCDSAWLLMTDDLYNGLLFYREKQKATCGFSQALKRVSHIPIAFSG